MSSASFPQDHPSMETIVAAIQARDGNVPRQLVGIAGPPGSGKSTYALHLATRLGSHAGVLPMDGYHLDNATLAARGLLERKGAPQTFNGSGFVELVRILSQQDKVSFPTFDRDKDQTILSGGQVDGKTRIVLIEGNYLLLNQSPWSELKSLFDLTIYLDVPPDVLRARLVARWREHGLPEVQAVSRAEENDMKNAELVRSASTRADFVIKAV